MSKQQVISASGSAGNLRSALHSAQKELDREMEAIHQYKGKVISVTPTHSIANAGEVREHHFIIFIVLVEYPE